MQRADRLGKDYWARRYRLAQDVNYLEFADELTVVDHCFTLKLPWRRREYTTAWRARETPTSAV